MVGTPGVGKTTLCSLLADRFGYEHVEVGKLASAERLYLGYDESRKTLIADVKRLREEVDRVIGKCGSEVLLLDGHYAHELVPPSATSGVFVIRLDPLVLYRRSVKLHADESKARENALSEFIGAISYEARKAHRWAVDVDATGLSVAGLSREFEACVSKPSFPNRPPIDWTENMDEKRIRRFLKVVEAQVLSR